MRVTLDQKSGLQDFSKLRHPFITWHLRSKKEKEDVPREIFNIFPWTSRGPPPICCSRPRSAVPSKPSANGNGYSKVTVGTPRQRIIAGMQRGKECARRSTRRGCIWCIWCVAAVLLCEALSGADRSDELRGWRRQRLQVEPHEPVSRGDSGAVGGWGGGDRAQGGGEGGRVAEIAEWRRQRSRACGVGEHIEGRWVVKAAGQVEENAPCCDQNILLREERDMLFCGEWDMPFEVLFPPEHRLPIYNW